MKQSAHLGGVLLGAMVMGGGCQRMNNIPPDALDDTPIAVDAAMARRDWEESRAVYPATGVMSTPNLYTFQSQTYRTNYSTAITELPLFGLNVLLMPYQIFAEPVWREKEYRAASIPPTYSAVPPLPPSEENQLEAPPAPPGQDAQPMESPTTMPSNG